MKNLFKGIRKVSEVHNISFIVENYQVVLKCCKSVYLFISLFLYLFVTVQVFELLTQLKMEEHRKALSKLCSVCQTQLTKPFFIVRSVVPVDSLRLLIFPYDCNLYSNNVCQKCKRKLKRRSLNSNSIKKSGPYSWLP